VNVLAVLPRLSHDITDWQELPMTMMRRNLLAGIACSVVLLVSRRSSASPALITVTKDANCGCCNDWIAHLREEGFTVTATDSTKLNQFKAKLGVPRELSSCHTAEVSGYVIEGHVPAGAIRKLLAERPSARGLAVPGMPIGSPGMEIDGQPPEPYSVVLFSPDGQKTFARFVGKDQLPGN
jgi:hypothetical protein